MKRLLYVIITCSLVFILIACSAPQELQTVKEAGWERNTIQMIVNSKNLDGGYTILNTERPYLIYDTRYAIEIFLEANKIVPNRKEIERYVTDSLKPDSIKLRDENDLVNLSYLTKIASILEISLDETVKINIINKVSALKKEDGFYNFPVSDKSLDKITISELVVDIYDNLKMNFNNELLQKNAIILMENNGIENINSNYKYTIYSSIFNILTKTGFDEFNSLSSINKLESDILKDGFPIPTNKLELYNIVAKVNILKILDKQPQIPIEFISYLNSIRLEDGGYSFIDDQLSDLQATVDIQNTFDDQVDLEKLTNYLSKYQNRSGLFTARKRIKESNIITTIMANKALMELGYDSINETKLFLDKRLEKGISAKEMFYVSETSPKLFNNYKNSNKTVFLDDKYYNLALSKATDDEKRQIVNQLKKDFWLDMSLDDVYLIVKSINQTNLVYEYDRNALESWLKSNQQKDGGFATKGDQSDLIETYDTLLIMKELGISPNSKEGISGYLNKLVVPGGGYSYMENGQATLFATFYGLECKSLIETYF